MPAEIFIAVTCVLLVAVAMSLARLAGTFSKAPHQQTQQQQANGNEQPAPGASNGQAASYQPQGSSSTSWDLWRTWQLVSGVAGLAIVPQVLVNIMVPGHTTLVPGLTALVLLCAYYVLKVGVEVGWGSR